LYCVPFHDYWYRHNNAASHWYEFNYDGETGVQLKGSVVGLHFVDGERGDADLQVNGKIKVSHGGRQGNLIMLQVMPMVFQMSWKIVRPITEMAMMMVWQIVHKAMLHRFSMFETRT
jgi:hypothetical protein